MIKYYKILYKILPPLDIKFVLWQNDIIIDRIYPLYIILLWVDIQYVLWQNYITDYNLLYKILPSVVDNQYVLWHNDIINGKNDPFYKILTPGDRYQLEDRQKDFNNLSACFNKIKGLWRMILYIILINKMMVNKPKDILQHSYWLK